MIQPKYVIMGFCFIVALFVALIALGETNSRTIIEQHNTTIVQPERTIVEKTTIVNTAEVREPTADCVAVGDVTKKVFTQECIRR